MDEIVTLRRNKQEEAILAWERAVSGDVTYIDVEAEVIDGERFKFESPIFKVGLYAHLDKPRPIGERVTLRMHAMDIAVWDHLYSFLSRQAESEKPGHHDGLVYSGPPSPGGIQQKLGEYLIKVVDSEDFRLAFKSEYTSMLAKAMLTQVSGKK